MTCLVEEVDYISYIVNPGRESSRIQIEDMSYECLFFGRGQIMLGITFFGLRGIVLYSITESDSRNVVRLYNTSDRHFLVCTNSLDNKKNPGFLGLRVHRIVVLWLRTMVRRSWCKRKVDGTLVWTRCLWITLDQYWIQRFLNRYLKLCKVK